MSTTNSVKATSKLSPQGDFVCKPRAERNSAVELLRIVAMLMIVLSHVCVHSGFDMSITSFSFNRLLVQWGSLGYLGVDIFVIISGYFLCTKSASAKSLSKLFTQIWFYSIALFVVCKFGFEYDYSLLEFISVFLPTLFVEYWFFTAYVVIAVLSPYFNILIKEASRKQLLAFLGCMIVMWVIIPTFTTRQMLGEKVPQFIMLYTIGAYFRMYPDNCFRRKNIRNIVTISSFALLFLSTIVIDGLSLIIPVFQKAGRILYETNSLLIVGCSMGLFSVAIYKKPFYSPLINTIAGCTFGVYLIHDNPAVRHILWRRIISLADSFTSPWLVLMILGAVILVFAVCTALEYLRQKTVAKPMAAMLDKTNQAICQFVKDKWTNNAAKPSER